MWSNRYVLFVKIEIALYFLQKNLIICFFPNILNLSPIGTCVPLWSYHKCQCGPENILALDCGYSFAPFTLTENQEVHYRPTRLFKHYTKLPNTRWKTETSNQDAIQSLSVTFRTLSSNGYLLQSHNKGFEAYTHLGMKNALKI